MKIYAALIGLTITLASCGNEPLPKNSVADTPPDPRWRLIGSVNDKQFTFVEIDPAGAQEMFVYRDAIDHLCDPNKVREDAPFAKTGGCFQVGFFLKGDKVPPPQNLEEWNRKGMWRPYEKKLALYWATEGEFVKWDCKRAGKDWAPPSAECR